MGTRKTGRFTDNMHIEKQTLSTDFHGKITLKAAFMFQEIENQYIWTILRPTPPKSPSEPSLSAMSLPSKRISLPDLD